MRRNYCKLILILPACCFCMLPERSHATQIKIDIPTIGSAGLGDFSIVGKSKDDTLLWVSGEITVGGKASPDRFRLWSLETDTYYALSFGASNDSPGRIVGLCGYTSGLNSAYYDSDNGSSIWNNFERKGEREITYGGYRWKITYNASQGEFNNIFEEFDFTYSAARDQLTVKHVAEGDKDHPVEYLAGNALFGNDATIDTFLSALQKDTHKWNAASKPFTIECLDAAAGTGLLASTCPASIPSAVLDIAREQPSSVPEPGTGSLMIMGAFSLAATRERGKQSSQRRIEMKMT